MEAPGGSVGQLQAAVALKADASALTNIYTKAETNSAISQATTQLRSTLEGPGGSIAAAQADATAALNALPSKLDASVITNYYTKTEANNALAQTETRVSANAQSLGQIQREADADAIQTLDDMLSSEADRQAIRNLSADAALQMRAVVDDGLAVEAQARIALTASVDDVRALLSTDYYVKSDADQATAQMLQQLQTTMEAPGGSVGLAQAAAQEALNALPSKADASALTNIYTKAETNSAISDLSNALTARVDRSTATCKLRITTEATPDGANARIGLIAEASDSATTHTAGLFLVAEANGDTTVAAVANKFLIAADSADDADRKIPFMVDGGGIYIDGDMYAPGSIHAQNLTVDGRLQLTDTGAFTAFKETPDDTADGLVFGLFPDGAGGVKFSLVASRAQDGKEQSISLTNAGFVLRNPGFLVGVGEADPPVNKLTSEAVYDLRTEDGSIPTEIIFTGIVGGGAGAMDGINTTYDGTASSITLYDGTTPKLTLTSTGGTNNSRSNVWGGGHEGYGLGGVDPVYWQSWGGSSLPISRTVDLVGYSNPRLAVIVGQGGSSPPRFTAPGAPGRVQYVLRKAGNAEADVIPIKPTLMGTFSLDGGGGIFPDLGPGIWTIWAGGNNGLGMSDVNTGSYTTHMYFEQVMTFIASERPAYASARAAITINFAHYAMGGRV